MKVGTQSRLNQSKGPGIPLVKVTASGRSLSWNEPWDSGWDFWERGALWELEGGIQP